MNNKVYKIILFFSFIFLGMLFLSSCGGTASSTHSHSWSNYHYDEQSHWKECSCGEKSNLESHVFEEWITMVEPTEVTTGTAKRVCRDCDYEETKTLEMLAHIHSYSKTWSYDRNNHWHEANCTHDYDVRVIDFEEHKLNQNRECEVCHYIRPIEQLEFELDTSSNSYQVKGIGNLYEMDVVIPRIYNGLPVTSICDGAFSGTNIKSIIVPNSIQRIGKEAFYECPYLNSMTLPFIGEGIDSSNNYFGYLFGGEKGNGWVWNGQGNSLNEVIITEPQDIGDYAFTGCDSVKKIVLPTGVQRIGYEAFKSCVELCDINIPDSVSFIDEKAFAHCFKLSSIHLPLGITDIKWGTFMCCNALQAINLPETISKIESRAFYSCINLRNVVLPNSLLELESEAFSNCIEVQELKISNQLKTIKMSTFRGLNRITHIEIPSSVTLIEPLAFSSCPSLLSVTIGKNVTDIKKDAFAGCHSLVEIYNLSSLELSKNDENLGFNVEIIHSSLNEQSIIKKDGDYQYILKDNEVHLMHYSGSSIDLDLPDKIGGASYTIGRGAFCAVNLHSVTIPNTVKNISEYAFSSSDIVEVKIGDAVQTIERQAFSYCTKLEKISLGRKIESIGYYAFHCCDELNHLILPSSLKSIEIGAFCFCKKLDDLSYQGTTSSFNSIHKDEQWNFNTIFTEIKCSNGSIYI